MDNYFKQKTHLMRQTKSWTTQTWEWSSIVIYYPISGYIFPFIPIYYWLYLPCPIHCRFLVYLHNWDGWTPGDPWDALAGVRSRRRPPVCRAWRSTNVQHPPWEQWKKCPWSVKKESNKKGMTPSGDFNRLRSGKSPSWIGKLTISMGHFQELCNKLPEGNCKDNQ